MSDTDQGGGQQVAVRQPRQIRPVENAVPLFDTALFEHMGRIASVMAQAKLVPDCLQNSVGDCLMVVNQAQRWNLDPFAVAQCCSVVHGRLMYEGKLISAVIESKLKIKLECHFTSEKGKTDYRVYVSDKPFTDAIVAKLKPGGTYQGWRIIDGSVAEWLTLDKGGKVNQAWTKQPDMQLRYRGARVWCRAYEPALMLGIYTDDEMDLLRADQVHVVSSTPIALTSGFGDATDAEFRKKPAGAAQAGDQGDPPNDAAQSSDGAGASARTAGEAESAEIVLDEASGAQIDAKTGEVLQEPTPDTDKGAAEAEAEEAMHAGAPAEEEVVEEEETTAPAGEVYLMYGERFGDDGKRQTYKDGENFSKVTEKGAMKLTAYDHHAERIEKGAAGQEGEQSQKEPTTTTSGGSTTTSAGERQSETASTEVSPAFAEAAKKILAAAHWLAAKQAMRSLQGTEDWKTADQSEGDRMRSLLFSRYQSLVGEGVEQTPIPADIMLFSLWMDYGAETAKQIDGLFPSLMRGQEWPKMSEAQKNEFGRRMLAAKERLGG